MRLPPLALFALVGLTGGIGACSRRGDAPTAAGSAAVPLAASAQGGERSARAVATVLDFVGGFDACTLSHRGVLLDLGDATMRARMSSTTLKTPDVEIREHEGASWVSLRQRSLELSFVSPTETSGETGVVVEARALGGAAKSASIYLNGKSLGVLPLTRGEAKVVSLRAPSASIARGSNELLVRLIGGGRATHDDLAELDWIRVGPADGDAPYSAPTRSDALTTVSIGGLARRGISLRAPGSVRCGGFVPNGAILEGQIGVSGGTAEAEVRVLVDRAEPRVVGSFRLGGEGAPAWQPISLPLGDLGTLAAVELVAKSSTKGARIVFAEPRVVAGHAVEPIEVPQAKGVILVVLGTLSARSLAPYGGALPTTELSQLAAGGMVFEAHRSTTSFASGALASMLTGLPPRVHGVSDPEAMLGAPGLTIAEAARQAGVATGMFTANPTTNATYGFARGWETFVSHVPADEAPATTVFDDVERWLDLHKEQRFLVVIHARGGHPPWDVASDEKDLAPAGYAGSLDAKHAGEMLAKVRRSSSSKLFTDADRERAFALHGKAVLAHDAALGRLVAKVRALGREQDTTFIVTADVGVDAAARAPFLEEDALDEGALAVPLVVRAPGKPSRARVPSPTESIDIARTALVALGLEPPPQMRGESVWAVAESGAEGPERPRIATTASRFSARWSGFVLTGSRDREGRLCNLSLEADCVSDVRATHPLAAEIMRGLVFDDLTRSVTPRDPKVPLTPTTHPVPDALTSAALRAWGVTSGGPAH
jgi:hypothetical protein